MERHVLAQITFGPWRDDADEAWLREVDDAFNELQGNLLRSGQAMEHAPYGVVAGQLQAFVRLPRPDALEQRHCSEHILESWEKISNVFGCQPSVVILDHGDMKQDHPVWQEAPWLVIYGSSLECCPPVRNHKLRPVPTYLLPLDWRQCDELSRWEDKNDTIYRVWIHSDSLEEEAYRVLADPLSALNVEAGDHARVLEKVTGKPIYIEIYRYFMLPGDAEFNRPGPLCGGAWKVEDECFGYRCEPCRIVCSLGNTEDENDLASIGTWRGLSPA